MKTTFIYALCEPGTRSIRYIGKTYRIKQRFKEHLRDSIKNKTHLGNWLRLLKSQQQKPEMIILREVPIELWEIAEERYIRLARGLGMNLVNSTDGGEGVTMTPEIRDKISLKNTGKIRSPELKAQISAALTGANSPLFGIKRTVEAREKMSAALTGSLHPLFGKKRSPETCAKIGAAQTGGLHHNFGKTASAETSAKMSAGQRASWVIRRMKKKAS